MTIPEFIAKWRKVELKERSAAHEHFIDLCSVLGHQTPAAADPLGTDYCFEKGATKVDGDDGWADVWKRGFFGWEYKGKHANLDKAYSQLLLYRESLENPPLLVVCDMDRFIIRTNFTNTPTIKHEFSLEELSEPDRLRALRHVFFDPDALRPLKTTRSVTEEAAQRITEIAQALRKRKFEPQKVARFLDRLVFCMFAQDVGLLPPGLFRQLIENTYKNPDTFTVRIGELFKVMAVGGGFGPHTIKWFNGDLFADIEVLKLTEQELINLRWVSLMDWSGIDASVFGTLFERGLDPSKREQLGAHYTSREDIETLVDPVILEPLRKEWADVQADVEELLKPKPSKAAWRSANKKLLVFVHRLQQVQILDPACGSGNFLYVSLQKLKNLEKQVILFAMEREFPAFLPHVGPWQLHAIEVNPYAYELAQMTVWIGWLQWTQSNGFGEPLEPILQKLDTFKCADAILTKHKDGSITEPSWPAVDFIIGNPPFLGTKKLRGSLGDEYVQDLFTLYGNRLPNFSDLCCYWFEKARALIEEGRCVRAGLLATQGIRGGLNREVLNRIKVTGDIFFGISDRDWILEGANVHVSMVGFDDGTEKARTLDGKAVLTINADLTSSADTTKARRIRENLAIGFVADVKSGKFDLAIEEALPLLQLPNPNGLPNSDVLRPWVNGIDILRQPRNYWIVDYPSDVSESEAAKYEAPFELVRKRVYPSRRRVKRKVYRDYWWLHAEPCDVMRKKIAPLARFLVTPTVSKYRIFSWMSDPTLADHQLIVFARDDDYFFGILHSRIHEVWSRRKGTQVREAESGFRYTPTSTFETFPFPKVNGHLREQVATAARELDRLRSRWLRPPEWMREQTLEFPARVDGPWARFVTTIDKNGMGLAKYVRQVPEDATAKISLKKRTITRLYNQNPTWLVNAHNALNEAVFAAYGWDLGMSDDQLLARVLELNLTLSSEA